MPGRLPTLLFPSFSGLSRESINTLAAIEARSENTKGLSLWVPGTSPGMTKKGVGQTTARA
jgi:hypothetical protein